MDDCNCFGKEDGWHDFDCPEISKPCSRCGVLVDKRQNHDICRSCRYDDLLPKATLFDEMLGALRVARRAMQNDWHNKPRIGMQAQCELADRVIEKANKIAEAK